MKSFAQSPELRAGEADDGTRALEDQLVVVAFARLKVVPLGLSLGIVTGLILFMATTVLLVRAELVASDRSTGSHLALLGHYFPGYEVTWVGAFVGLPYGFLSGFLVGVFIAAFVNVNQTIYSNVLTRRIRRGALHDV